MKCALVRSFQCHCLQMKTPISLMQYVSVNTEIVGGKYKKCNININLIVRLLCFICFINFFALLHCTLLFFRFQFRLRGTVCERSKQREGMSEVITWGTNLPWHKTRISTHPSFSHFHCHSCYLGTLLLAIALVTLLSNRNNWIILVFMLCWRCSALLRGWTVPATTRNVPLGTSDFSIGCSVMDRWRQPRNLNKLQFTLQS